MGEKLTGDELEILRIGSFSGPEIGSNYWPLLALEGADGKQFDGELIDGLARRGFLTASRRKAARVMPGDPEQEIPDIDCRYDYDLTPAGRAALSREEGR